MKRGCWAVTSSVLVIACGGGEHATSGSDAGSDAAVVDAAVGVDAAVDASIAVDAGMPGPVEVRLLSPNDGRTPIVNLPVVFLEPDGTLAATTLSDSNGVASAELLPGGSVLAFGQTTFPDTRPWTWAVLGVEPGDVITLGGLKDSGPAIGEMTITVPARADATSYVVRSPCGFFGGSGGLDVTIEYYDVCADSPFPLVAVAYDTTSVLGTILVPSVVASDGSGYVVPGAWQAFAERPVRITGVPRGVMNAFASFGAGIESGVKVAVTLAGGAGGPVDGAIDLTAKWIDGLDEGRLEISVYDDAADVGYQSYRVWVPGGLGTATVDLTDLLLPWLGVPTYDAATRTIAWPHEGDAAWDATSVELLWQAGAMQGSWTILAPPGAHAIVLPEVPAAFAAWLPEDAVATDLVVRLFEASDLDWDGTRATGFDRQGRVPRTYEIAGTPTVRESHSGEAGGG